MVGGLVEQEHVRLLREHDAEAQAPALAARERRDRAREVARREKPRWLRERRDLVLELVAAREVVAVGHVGEALERGRRRPLAASCCARWSSSRSSTTSRKPGQERAEHVALGGDLVRLPVVAERRVAPEDDRAARRARSRRATMRRSVVLPEPFGRDERHAIADRERERDALEERVAGVPEPQIGHLKDGHPKRLRD